MGRSYHPKRRRVEKPGAVPRRRPNRARADEANSLLGVDELRSHGTQPLTPPANPARPGDTEVVAPSDDRARSTARRMGLANRRSTSISKEASLPDHCSRRAGRQDWR